MEDNNNIQNNQEKEVNNNMAKSGKEFKAVKPNQNTNSKNKKTKSNGFAKTVAVPFLSGVLGAGIVLGTCFGIPEIK